MKKRMLVLLLLAITLSGCRQSSEVENGNYSDRFITIYVDYFGNVVYDTKTGVEYWRNGYSFTLLVDKDGKPLIYEGE